MLAGPQNKTASRQLPPKRTPGGSCRQTSGTDADVSSDEDVSKAASYRHPHPSTQRGAQKSAGKVKRQRRRQAVPAARFLDREAGADCPEEAALQDASQDSRPRHAYDPNGYIQDDFLVDND